MADPRLTPSQSLIRKLSTMVATVAALAVIAMGVQIGTSGLGLSDDRAPATANARPASALVDLTFQPTAEPDLAARLVALLPPGAMESAAGAGAAPQGPRPVNPPAPPPPGAEPPGVVPAVPAPSDLLPADPVAPVPAPPTTLPPAPVSPVPVPPVTEPEPEAVVDPVVQVVENVKAILGL